MINCAGCGANMRFNPELQLLKCDYCDSTADPENLQAAIISPESRVRLQTKDIFEAKIYTCPQCGAELVSDDDTAATFCNYCGASVMFEERSVTMKAPSYVIPFKKSKDQCQQIYSKFVKSSLFAPKSFIKNDTVERFRGIYMPFWVYDMGMQDDVHMAGSKSHRRGDYIITDHYDLAAHVRAHGNGVSFDASAAFADELSQSLAPYDFRECKGFSAGYLSGFYADTADVQPQVYEVEAKNVIASDIANKLMKEAAFRGYNATTSLEGIGSRMRIERADMAYFPVWFLANYSKGYVSYAVVNGQTGKISADIPIDYKKYIIGSLICAVPVMLILDLFFTPKPALLAIIAAIFAIVIYNIANSALNQLYTRTHYLNDAGLRSARNETSPEVLAANNNSKKSKVKRAGGFSSTMSTIAFILIVTGGSLASAGAVGPAMIAFVTAFVFFMVASTSGTGVSKGKVTHKKVVFKQPFREKAKVLVKPLIAIGICALLLIVNPYIDIVYYIVVFACMILLLTCIADIVSVHNKLTRRIPKQFGRRGGDENESNFF